MSGAKTKVFRVLIEDTTFYHAYITAPTEAEAMEIADRKFGDYGVEGFTAEESCDIASDGTTYAVIEADEVQS